MILKSPRPVREFRFKLSYRYIDGEEVARHLTPEQDKKMEKLLQKLEEFFPPEQPVSKIIIDVGDRQEVRITPQDELSPGGMNRISDIR